MSGLWPEFLEGVVHGCVMCMYVYISMQAQVSVGGMLPQQKFEIRCSEIASEAIFGQTVATLLTEYWIWQF